MLLLGANVASGNRAGGSGCHGGRPEEDTFAHRNDGFQRQAPRSLYGLLVVPLDANHHVVGGQMSFCRIRIEPFSSYALLSMSFLAASRISARFFETDCIGSDADA